jgi:hypothetical protein
MIHTGQLVWEDFDLIILGIDALHIKVFAVEARGNASNGCGLHFAGNVCSVLGLAD